MEIGRRDFLTGLAAVAAARSLPALAIAEPTPPALLACATRAFPPGDLRGVFRDIARSEGSKWVTGWHCHVHTFGHRTLRHLASGFTFATDPRNPADFVSHAVWLVLPAGAEPPPYSSELLLIGHTAGYIRIASGRVDFLQRHSGDRRQRPFLYHEAGDQFYYDDEDVPPLPRVESFAPETVRKVEA